MVDKKYNLDIEEEFFEVKIRESALKGSKRLQTGSCCILIIVLASAIIMYSWSYNYWLEWGRVVLLSVGLLSVWCYLCNRTREVEARHGLKLMKIEKRVEELEKVLNPKNENIEKI